MNASENTYREILINPIRKCATYSPKFGHKSDTGFSLSDFQSLYGKDPFYKWLGLDNPLMYSAHKAAGGITSVYRQLGIGCERLVRKIFMDMLQLSHDDVIWSYTIPAPNGKRSTLSLDGRIDIANIDNIEKKELIKNWMKDLANILGLDENVASAMKGIVFEIRQGYKSKDSKRQNADISNASNAYANGYIPCLMVMSTQIDEDVVARYSVAKWVILEGFASGLATSSTYTFFKEIIGFDLEKFMSENQTYFQSEIKAVLTSLLTAK